MAYKFCNK